MAARTLGERTGAGGAARLGGAKLDLNLVFVAEALFRHQNVSKAARELEVTQSAVSHALAKLRAHFGDALFVRVPKGVAPTEVAMRLRVSFEELAAKAKALSAMSVNEEELDPKSLKMRFTIATTDYLEILLMPKLLPRLAKEAPGVQVSVQPTAGDLPSEALQLGKVDVACAGFYRDVPEGFYQVKLFEDDFAVGCRKKHPLLEHHHQSSKKLRLSKESFDSARHARITLRGDFKSSKTDRRDVVYGSYSFTGMAWVLSTSNLLLTAPRRLLEQYRERFPIEILDHPSPPSPIKLRMVWHALTHRDPGKSWLRRVIQELVSS